MSAKEIISYSLWALIFITLQILLMQHIVLFGYAFCFIYIAIILLLPVEVNTITAMLIALISGLLVDVFYNTLGIHAAASVLVAYTRPIWLRMIVDIKDADRIEIELGGLGVIRFSMLTFPLILLHHSALFFIEINNFNLLPYTFIKIIASSFFTMTILLLTQSFRKS